MPELPEVQTIAVELHARLQNAAVLRAEVLLPRSIGYPDIALFTDGIQGRRILSVSRRAKYLLFLLDEATLVVHLRMTGRLLLETTPLSPHPHARVVLHLNAGRTLHFIDARTFGRLYLLVPGDVMPLSSYHALGPEPLEPSFTPALFAERLRQRRGALKSVLLDQRLVAGLGNIYADEVLYQAGLNPRRPVDSLEEAEMDSLHAAIVDILSKAVEQRGTTFSDYRTSWGLIGGFQDSLSVFRRTGQPCPSCGTSICRESVGGRSSHYCPLCQPF